MIRFGLKHLKRAMSALAATGALAGCGEPAKPAQSPSQAPAQAVRRQAVSTATNCETQAQWVFLDKGTPRPAGVGETTSKLLNGDFEEQPGGGAFVEFLTDNTMAWFSTDSNSTFEIWGPTGPGVSRPVAYSGTEYIELNAYSEGVAYQDIVTVPGSTLEFSFAHRARGTGSEKDTMTVYIGEKPVDFDPTLKGASANATVIAGLAPVEPAFKAERSQSTDPVSFLPYDGANFSTYSQTAGQGSSSLVSGVPSNLTDGTTKWGVYKGTYVVPVGQTCTRLAFRATGWTGSAGSGNFLDGVVLQRADTDGDGLLDDDEKAANGSSIDTDADGIPDHLDIDSDNDGIPDASENKGGDSYLDTDADGIPDVRDLDSDNDGIYDASEATDGLTVSPNGTIAGPYGTNGLADSLETSPDSGTLTHPPVDTDGDGAKDFQDLDSDADGIPDAVEAGDSQVATVPNDADGDGTPDFREKDSDNDGVPDELEVGADKDNPIDTDGDGNPDFQDADSDNDNIPDSVETAPTSNCSGYEWTYQDFSLLPDNRTYAGKLLQDGVHVADVSFYLPSVQEAAAAVPGRTYKQDNFAVLTATTAQLSPTRVEFSVNHQVTGGFFMQQVLIQPLPGVTLKRAPFRIVIPGVAPWVNHQARHYPYFGTKLDGTPTAGILTELKDFSVEFNGKSQIRSGDVMTNTGAMSKDSGYIDFLVDADSTHPYVFTYVTEDYASVNLANETLDIDVPKCVDEYMADSDGDDIPDFRDLDSDNDGVPDMAEAGDTDLSTNVPDTDGDGTADYLDLDADGDGLFDAEESGANLSFDSDGRVAGPYGDNGLSSAVETSPESGVLNYGLLDTDGDGTYDFQDVDSDGDGISDSDEAGDADPTTPARDTDNDGTPDYLDLDSDNDGIPDSVEAGDGDLATAPADSDNDGTPDYLETDSDNDGLFDAFEVNPTATVRPDGTIAGPYGLNGLADSAETLPESGTLKYPVLDSDSDGTPNFRDLDSDGDKIPDGLEAGDSDPTTAPVDTDGDGILDYMDADSDNDGVPDSVEAGDANLNTAPVDSDNDGTADFLDLDADGDGIFDALESGSGMAVNPNGTLAGPYGTNGLADAVETVPDSGVANYQLAGGDTDGAPDYLDTDSDGDGLPDSVEKGPTGFPVDSDGDGTADYLDLDSDNDGINDSTESDNAGIVVDTDQDGTPDYIDLDSDNDGLADLLEGNVQTDGDGKPNYRDIDSDADGIPDSLETAGDTDGDGVPNYLDLDSDNDGVPDSVEAGDSDFSTPPRDTDYDGIPDFLETDADNDGIFDGVEAGHNLLVRADGTISGPYGTNGLPENVETSPGSGVPDYALNDADNDGIADFQETDSDNDGIPDSVEKGADGMRPMDTDMDGVPDYRDTDSDNDGIPDSVEAGSNPLQPRDSDGDGTPDYRDVDSDGDSIPDRVETNNGGFMVDTDSDGTPDVLDLDTDNDGILDMYEPWTDMDGDGAGSWRDLDADGDGLLDNTEKGADGIPDDFDMDGTPDFLDLDSDNDGLTDATEKGYQAGVIADTDKDGIPNVHDLDSDNDCVPDSVEPAYSSDVVIPNVNPSDNCPAGQGCNVATGDCVQQCAADSACGAADSGRVCDASLKVCVDGCRGTDGNSCPNGAVCSSTTSAQGTCLVDTDNDGLADSFELANGMNPANADTDADGIPDGIEGAADTDKDGTPDALDLDSDNDGIPDSVEKGDGELPVDTDGDGTPDFRDTDSDNDGWLDSEEKAVDTDGDGTPDYRDLDSDGDGLADAHEKAIGTQRTDTDSDDDGIPDNVEAGEGATAIDTDGDGTIDALDTDSDNDGIPDGVEKGANGATPVDTDDDGTPDFRDLDSDNDGIPDSVEAGANPATPVDTDKDGAPDYLDLDSDGDGVSDKTEAGVDPATPVDTDKDGTPDYLDLDSDNDCVADSADVFSARINAVVPSKDADTNCPASAPVCDVKVGRCVLPEGLYSTEAVVLEGSGASGCSSTGDAGGLMALVTALGFAVRSRRRK